MFKRCHSLKKSSINIKNFPKPKSSEKSILTQVGDKQNIQSNQTYTLKTYTKVKISESVELKSSQTMIKVAKPLLKIKQKNIMNEQKQIEQVKSLCKQIQQIESKIESYQDLLNRKEARHEKQKQKMMDEKQEKLSLMIQLYQKQRQKNEQLNRELQQFGINTHDIMYMSTKQPQLQRRTTATFNFNFQKH